MDHRSCRSTSVVTECIGEANGSVAQAMTITGPSRAWSVWFRQGATGWCPRIFLHAAFLSTGGQESELPQGEEAMNKRTVQKHDDHDDDEEMMMTARMTV